MSLLIVVTLLQRYRTGDRRYAREYCCSFEKSCLFFLKDFFWACPLKISHLAQEDALLKNSTLCCGIYFVCVLLLVLSLVGVHQNE